MTLAHMYKERRENAKLIEDDCQSELCKCAEKYGFHCYRHLHEAYIESMKEIERLKQKYDCKCIDCSEIDKLQVEVERLKGAMFDVDEIDKLIQQNGYRTIEVMAAAIYQAQQEKLKEVK